LKNNNIFVKKNKMTVEGKIYKIFDTVNVSEKFSKKDFVLEINNNQAYVQKVLFTLVMDKIDLLDGIEEGNDVEVNYQLNGKEWISPNGEVKFFNTLSVLGIQLKDLSSSQNNFNQNELRTRVEIDNQNKNVDDDMPF
jgi:hypothetical protein